MNLISTADAMTATRVSQCKTKHATHVSRRKNRIAAFLTADDDWIARNQGKTIVFLLTAATVVPGVIEWMI